jgi:non-canonical (house-cleaning) NTP pyrophosphatase
LLFLSEDEDFGILLQALESGFYEYSHYFVDCSFCVVYEEKASHLPKPEIPRLMCIITGQS